MTNGSQQKYLAKDNENIYCKNLGKSVQCLHAKVYASKPVRVKIIVCQN